MNSLKEKETGGKLPLFTSCCPGWVKFAEQSYPELLDNLSTCMSPQAMTGSIGRKILEDDRERGEKKIKMVSVMPCTAKKFEKGRDELSRDGKPLVDNVLTTQELGKMIMQAGIQFAELEPSSMDLPMSSSSGAGTVFGRSGGVSEAVIRYAAAAAGEKIDKKDMTVEKFDGNPGIKVMTVPVGGEEYKICIVQGIKNADIVAASASEGKCMFDIVEVMACPGGCIGGAGQPVDPEGVKRVKRIEALEKIDRKEPVKNTTENPFIDPVYKKYLGGKTGSREAHELLHTTYSSRKRIQSSEYDLIKPADEKALEVKVCVGTSCFLRGSQSILSSVIEATEDDFKGKVSVKASFCREQCDRGPTVIVGNRTLHKTNTEEVLSEIRNALS